MKIMKHGFMSNSPKGIYCTCDYCRCEYIVENREDLQYRTVYDYDSNKLIEYEILCPECGCEIYLGIDPNKTKNLWSPYKEIFNRPDWKERFEVSL